MDTQMPPALAANPFRGLAQYRRNDPLFARDKDVELIQSRLWSSRVTVMFAGSGVGKSSFLNAKLIPSLEQIFQPAHIAVPDANSWARTDPRKALIEAREKVTAGKSTRRGGIIILDQFEEVFQHFPTPMLLREFGQELATMADDEAGLNVRLLISIREEFLADLTSLDDFLPGVLTNYYRLRRLTTRQAKFIIENTARLSGLETSPKVDALIQDLCLLDRGQRRYAGVFVDPPYLQIVCRRVWNREQEGAAAPFLSSYEPGEAERELHAYCDENLGRLSGGQRTLVRKALGHLTGPHEAKKFGRVSDLAREIRARDPIALAGALDALAAPDVRMLRAWEESPASDWAVQNPGKPRQVYQLYHDMYARMLWRWKEEQESRDKWRSAARWVALAAAIVFFAVWPFTHRMLVTRAVNLPTYGNFDEFSAVLDMRNAFGRTMLFRGLGDRPWRHYTEKLETLSALKLDMDGAIAYRLAGLAVSPRSAADADISGALGPGRYLAGTVTGLPTITDAVMAPEQGREGVPKLIMTTMDGRIVESQLDGRKTSRYLNINENPQDGEGEVTNLVKVLCVSRDGKQAVAAWAARKADESGSFILIGTFDTETGERVGEPRYLTGARKAKAVGPSRPRSADAGPDPRFATTAAALTQMQGVYDSEGKRFAVMAEQFTVVYDGDQRWVVEQPRIGRLAFVTGGIVAASEKVGGYIWNVGWWSLERGKPPTKRELPYEPTLPWLSQLVLREKGQVFAVVNKKWHWVSVSFPSSSREEQGLQEQEVPFQPFAGTSDTGSAPSSRFYPQAFDQQRDVLLFMDSVGRFAFSHTKKAPSVYTPLPITDQRGEAAAASRQLTPASLSSLSTGQIVSIDNWGTDARVWQVQPDSGAGVSAGPPESTPSRTAESCAPNPSPSPRKDAYYCSASNEWMVAVRGQARFEIAVSQVARRDPSQDWAFTVESRPLGVFVSSTGDRLLLLFGDVAWHVRKADVINGQVTRSGKIQKSIKDAVFGPGPDRVTMLTLDEVIIYSSESWTSDKAEWQAPCAGQSSWLLRKQDERSVILYSPFWVHRFTESGMWSRMMARLTRSGVVWPGVTSVLTDAPIDRDQFIPDGNGDMKLKQDGRDVNESERRFSAVERFAGTWSIRHWLSTATVPSCREKRADLPGAWRSQLCEWERVSGRRAGLGLNH